MLIPGRLSIVIRGLRIAAIPLALASSPVRVLAQPANAGQTAQPAAGAANKMPDRPTAAAARATGPVRVDGRLGEPDWQAASPIGALTQREPDEGDPATEDTEVRVLFDTDAIYFGIACRDRTPSGIVSTQLARDAELEVDDYLLVILDPFLDNRNGFFFVVNPAGARTDGQVSNNAEHTDTNWDGIWNAAARITPEGWVAEIEVPFKTLRFKPGQTVWGLNVERHIKRKNETARWAAARQDIWISNLAQAGRIENLVDIHQGRGLDIRPYVSAGRESGDATGDVGLDVFKNLTPNLNASLTINTDFAETEVDARQINLTRFPLFFPEKRTFFLEGAGVFDVAGLETAFHAELVPFFTRRIGLLGGEQVPILAGAKVIGRQGDYNIGFLDVQTRDIPDFPDAGQNLLAARVSRNILKQSWIGAIFTNGDPTGQGSNYLIGADARLATSEFRGGKNLGLSLFWMRTDDEASNATDYAGGFSLDYPNDLWDAWVSWKQIGDNFRPALGFVPRTGIRTTSVGVMFRPRPHRFGIRQVFFELRPEYITNLENRVENWRIEAVPLHLLAESGDQFEFGCTPEFERLPEPFEIADGIVIPAGPYQWTRCSVQPETASKRRWVLEAEASWGGFYDGDLTQIRAELMFKPSTHVALGVEVERNDVALPYGEFTTHVVDGRFDFAFSPNVSWANLVQYDSESRILGFQSRFRYILRPGNDVFLVLNRGWFREEEGGYRQEFDKLSAKLQYTFRF